MRRSLAAVFLCGVAVCAARADVTLRYSFEIKPGAAMPPQAVESMKSQLEPKEISTRLKGSKAFTVTMGINAIADFNGALITLLDSKSKQFVTVSATEYGAAVRKGTELPPDARKVMESMEFNFKTRATGHTVTIKGVQAEEREMVLTVELPSGPAGPSGVMRIVYSIWAPRSDEIARNPALQEVAEYVTRAYAGTNPADMMQAMFGQVPGFGEKLRTMMEEIKNLRVMLGFRGAMYMPGMAAMAEQLRKAGKPVPPGFDPDAPAMEFLMDLQELSADEIPASVFEVPQGYTLGQLDELLKKALPPRPGPAH